MCFIFTLILVFPSGKQQIGFTDEPKMCPVLSFIKREVLISVDSNPSVYQVKPEAGEQYWSKHQGGYKGRIKIPRNCQTQNQHQNWKQSV